MNKISRLISILAVALVLFVSFFAVACGNGENSDSNGGGGGHWNYENLQGYIRGVDFQDVAQAKICYNGEVKATSDDEGKFTVSVKKEDRNSTTGKITVEGSPSLTYFDYNSQQLVIIKLEEGMEVTDFYYFSGKVTEYNSGEIAVDGSSLRIDGTTVKTFSAEGNDRNFDLAFVHKDSLVSAYKEGYTCYLKLEGPEITGIPLANIGTPNDEQTTVVNGEEVTLKMFSGVTFRLKAIEEW